VQDSGGYSTGFTITQSVTIDAGGFNASVISTTATDLCTINAGTSDRVVLRGISFHGASVGVNAINVTQVGSLYVEHCSIVEFTNFRGAGVSMPNGGNLWVTDTDVRKCLTGLDVKTSGATPANLVAQGSRFAECRLDGVSLVANGAVATGWLTNCAASLCGIGFFVESASADAALTLTNCQAFENDSDGLFAETLSRGNATMFIAHCVVVQNAVFGVFTISSGGGIASVVGTSPGTNLIAHNGGGNAVGSAVILQ